MSGFSCVSPPSNTITLRACPGLEFFTCVERNTSFNLGSELADVLCKEPPKHDCDCKTCKITAPGGGCGNVGGDGASGSPPGSGPQVLFHYRGLGVGSQGLPGTNTAWSAQLGRHWTHDGERRIVVDATVANQEHVWLITRLGTFREFSTKDGGGVYTAISPTNEYRTLTDTGSGWTLLELDGTVHAFSASGRWMSTTDRFDNVTGATRDGQDRLMAITKPDGRSETFSYDAVTGKLEEIEEVGVDGTTTRPWTYTWVGDDLTEIERPDGTKWKFLYDAGGNGWLTHMILVSDPNAGPVQERIEAAFGYDFVGNVVQGWKGAMDFANGTETWTYTFDDPTDPTETLVVDSKGQSQTFFIDRPDLTSRVPFITQVTGDCPGCGTEPGTIFTPGTNGYDQLLPVQATDLDGVTTFTYNANGRMIERVEDQGGSDERTTSWTYSGTYPSLVTTVTRDSVRGTGFGRTTTYSYDSAGTLVQRREEGEEKDIASTYGAFDLLTEQTPDRSGTGSLQAINPPGSSTADEVSFTYDPTRGLRGGLVLTSRVDPLIGTTHFEHDAYNRRSATADPTGLRTETEYDDIDRVTLTRVCNVGASPSTTCASGGGPTLVTQNEYDGFGDLSATILPEGNRLEYTYESTTGRLLEVHRKPASMANKERTVYQYDSAGSRTLEAYERWNDTAQQWDREASTQWVYNNRCQVFQIIEAPGAVDQSVTEFEYGCDGNLDNAWDANHENAVTPSTSYQYDALDRLTEVRQPWGADPIQDVVVTYDYDVQDHLVSVVDGEGNQTTYSVSDRDLLTEEVSPVAGTTRHAYNDHGEMVTSIDARGVETRRTVDVLDRLELLESALSAGGPAVADLTTDFVYDDPMVPFSTGRLTSISKGSTVVDYEYDGLGRMTKDGELVMTYSDNGNATETTYPDGTVANWAYDYADRPLTLDVTPSGGALENVVTDALYLPSGPLERLDFASGVSEYREFTQRYAQDRLRLGPTASFPSGALLDWDYSLDGVSNVTQIVDGNSGPTRTYGYQDYQYYLDSAAGPWPGPLSWDYDKIGSRESETRDTTLDDYLYVPGTSGNTATLDRIDLGAPGGGISGMRDYAFGAAGHLEEVDSAGNLFDFSNDAMGRLGAIERASDSVRLQYDGRGFLRSAQGPLLFADDFESGDLACWSDITGGSGAGTCLNPEPPGTTATYTSGGILHALDRWVPDGSHEIVNIFYLGDRPVAQLRSIDGIFDDVETITTDHLGTPIVLADGSATVVWSGGFEPFGEDWQAGTSEAASTNGMLLRLPGQWVDEIWEDAASAVGLFQNGWRWYETGTGRYTRVDPLGIDGGDLNLFSYSLQRPTVLTDPLGLKIVVAEELKPFVECAKEVPIFRWAMEWFESNGDWSMKPLRSSPVPLHFGQVFPLKRDSGLPNCRKGGRIFPDDSARSSAPDAKSCSSVVRGIAHEIMETYAHCELGISASAAHLFVARVAQPTRGVDGLDDNIATVGCRSCRCSQALE